jgi:hypothetical protein
VKTKEEHFFLCLKAFHFVEENSFKGFYLRIIDILESTHLVSFLARQPEGLEFELQSNRIFFSDLNRALGSNQSQMSAWAIWKVKAACVRDVNPITTDKKPVVKEKYGH